MIIEPQTPDANPVSELTYHVRIEDSHGQLILDREDVCALLIGLILVSARDASLLDVWTDATPGLAPHLVSAALDQLRTEYVIRPLLIALARRDRAAAEQAKPRVEPYSGPLPPVDGAPPLG